MRTVLIAATVYNHERRSVFARRFGLVRGIVMKTRAGTI
jgi:hypothetical protein